MGGSIDFTESMVRLGSDKPLDMKKFENVPDEDNPLKKAGKFYGNIPLSGQTVESLLSGDEGVTESTPPASLVLAETDNPARARRRAIEDAQGIGAQRRPSASLLSRY